MVQIENENRLMNMGGSALGGWRGVAAGALAKPVAKHSRFTEGQIKSFLGLALLAYAVYRLVRPIVHAARADVGWE